MEKEDLVRIWKEFNKLKTKESKQKLIEYYFSYVQHIASNMSKKLNYKVSSSELASHGVDGLYQALDSYSEDRGVKFETFAYRRIAGSMIDVLRQEDWIPRSVRQRRAKIELTQRELSQKEGKEVNIDRVLEYLNINREEYHKNIKKYNPLNFVSIEECTNDNNNNELNYDFYKKTIDKKALSPDHKMIKGDYIINILKNNFNKTEYSIIYFYYYKKLTMKEISEKIGLNHSKISRLHKKAIKKLKSLIANKKVNLDLIK
jgi:RNA polymerase sigma factor for flagellar operon FliA